MVAPAFLRQLSADLAVANVDLIGLQPDQIYVRDGEIWSSAGISAGIDLALAMVAEDHGEDIAQATARQLVLYHRRSGGQSQFSTLIELKAPSGRFAALLAWAREHLAHTLTVERMAEQAGMSARHFSRAFIAETALPAGTDLVVVPGGFSYGDYLRCGAIAARAPIMDAVRSFAAGGGLVLGVCNGFQILCE
eukprot:gene35215-47327_t